MTMRLHKRALMGGAVAAALAGAITLAANTVAAQDEKVVIAVPAFLTGAGAPAFGIPSRNGAEVVINAINAGKVPAPYNTKGLAGRQIEAICYDESGGNTKQVTEYRNKVQKQGVDAFVGFISSGTCIAIAPIAEELKTLTLFSTCGTTRVFEELDKNPKYVFRTMSHSAADGVAAAHYVARKYSHIKGYTGINQNYGWGQDSWRDFDLAMNVLSPQMKASEKLQWPKLFAGQYGAEISALMLAPEEMIHTSLWGGDLEAFIFQATARGLFGRKQMLFSVAGTAACRLNKKMPKGIILGSRGPYGIYAANLVDTPLNKWFQTTYRDRYNTPPTQGSYQYAQSLLGLKTAYDKAAAAKGGKFPTTDEVIAQLEGLEYESIATTVRLALNNGHQGVTEHMLGVSKWDPEKGEPVVVDVIRFKGECVMPPEGVNSVDWIKGGMKGAKC